MDFLAGGLELLGGWLVGNKSRSGFCFNFVACSIWIWIGLGPPLTRPLYGILLVVVPALFINIRNYRKWSRESRHDRSNQWPV